MDLIWLMEKCGIAWNVIRISREQQKQKAYPLAYRR